MDASLIVPHAQLLTPQAGVGVDREIDEAQVGPGLRDGGRLVPFERRLQGLFAVEEPFGQDDVAGPSHRLAHRLGLAGPARQQVFHRLAARRQEEVDADGRRALVVQIGDDLGQFRAEEHQRLVDLLQRRLIHGDDDHVGRARRVGRGARSSRRTPSSPGANQRRAVEPPADERRR